MHHAESWYKTTFSEAIDDLLLPNRIATLFYVKVATKLADTEVAFA